MTEPVYMTIQITIPAHIFDDVELLAAFGSVVETMRKNGSVERFDDATVVRCAKHLVELFSEVDT